MFKKITGNILTVMLVAAMLLGAAGVAIPEPVNAEFPSDYYEVTMTIDAFTDAGYDHIDDITLIELTSGNGTDTWKSSSGEGRRTMVVSRIPFEPAILTAKVRYGGVDQSWNVSFSEKGYEGTYTETYHLLLNEIKCTYSYEVTHYHSNHIWVYSANDNVISARCDSAYECKLEGKTPTLTLNAEDKEYNGKPVTATLTPNDTWTTENGLPEIDESKITYSPENSKNAGTYSASYIVEAGQVGARQEATKQFKIKKRPVLVGGFKVMDKEYDGTTEAKIDTSGLVILGKVSGDDLKVSVTGEFEDPEEGENKNVNLTYTFTGSDAGNYCILDLPITQKTAKANIYVRGNGGPDDYDEDSDGVNGSGSGKAAGSSKNSPNTGDENDITGLLAMMLVSAGALGAMGYRRRRENRR